MVTLNIDRQRLFSFSKKIEADYGKFEISEQNEIAAKVVSFTVDNLTFFDSPNNERLKLFEFQKMVLDRDYVPLDLYCARALYENKEAMWELQGLWNRCFISGQLEVISFLGNVVRQDTEKDYFATFKYQLTNNVDFVPLDGDSLLQKNQDFFLVFKTEFIANL